MAFDIGSVGGIVMKYAITPLFWALILLVVFGGLIGILWFRKKRKLRFEGIEETAFGVNTGIRCGWMGLKWYLKGLWTSGTEAMMTADGEEIMNFQESDFTEVNGVRGIRFYRDPISRRLFPISNINIKNKEVTATIPDREYIDTALRILDATDRETEDRTMKILQMATWALVVIGCIILLIVMVQYVKNGQADVAKSLADGNIKCLESAKQVCSTITSATIHSGAP